MAGVVAVATAGLRRDQRCRDYGWSRSSRTINHADIVVAIESDMITRLRIIRTGH